MISAELDKQLMIMVSNSIGSLAEVMSVIAASGINLVALCAYEVGNKVAVMFVTEDNNAAKKLLEKQGFHVQEEEVVLLSIDNKPGALQSVTEKIAGAGISLKLIYGSVEKKGTTTRIIMIADNNLDVMVIIKTELERSS